MGLELMIKGIFFDAADVFYCRRESTARFALNLLRKMGYDVELSEEDAERLKRLHVLATVGRISHETYWDEFFQAQGLTSPRERKIALAQVIERAHDIIAVPGGREAMRGLDQRGFVLGIVTDTMYPLEWKMGWLAKVGIAEFIDIVTCSTVLGVHKPDPAMYMDAVKQARIVPNEAAFVGHDEVELDGARKAGLATVAVNYLPKVKADYYARSLVDLLNVPIFLESNA